MERTSLEFNPSAFSSRINTGVPVEIVEAENQAGNILPNENGAQNLSAEDAMEISVEGDPQGSGLDSTQLSAVPRTVDIPAASISSVQAAASRITLPAQMPSSQVTPSSSSSVRAQLNAMAASSGGVTAAQTQQSLLTSTNFPSNPSSSMLANSQSAHSSQLTRTVMEQLSDAQALEISSDAIPSMSLPSSSGYPIPQIPQISSYSSTPNVSSLMASRGHPNLLSGNVSYSDLDLSVGANTSTVLDDPESPSSAESNFDSSELLSNPLTHQDEVTQRLAQSGPIGIAAAAAIMSGTRKRKRQHTFETNPSFRKRHCSKLTKKLKETIDELAARVGLQAVVVTYRPGKGNGKNDPAFKVFGAAPLVNIVKNQKETVVNEMEAALHQQSPPVATPPTTSTQGEPLFELPPLVFEGIPTPVHKMTQAQLRTFIPNMLKYSTGRGKPGWGKDDVRPPWWPEDVPWANVRSDIRTHEQKKALQWTDALRRIVINCYLHHGRMDLLPEFSLELLHQYLTPQVAEQLQVQLDNLQQQQQDPGASGGDIAMTTMHANSAADEVAAALNEITEASGGVEGRDDPEMMVGDNQQVFTVDTGIGNCDMAGMPTLADASLAETAARLQQLADETGEVQYATQIVTVTERDAKALGQPVGSTTNVLLTAYPGGHSGSANSAAAGGGGAEGGGDGTTAGGREQAGSIPASDEEAASQQFLTSQQNSGNVQVVYSASHIEPLPDSMAPSSDLAGFAAPPNPQVPGMGGGGSSVIRPQADTGSVPIGVSDYLNPASSQEMMMPHADVSGVGGASEADATNDLAAELIREYSLGAAEGAERKQGMVVKDTKSPES